MPATREACELDDHLLENRLPGEQLDGDFALLQTAVREGGSLALARFRKPIARGFKSDGSEVSEADLAVDRFLKETLRGARPDYGWLSEESEDDRSRLSAERVWIVDPIDGTRAFLKGAPEWAVSAALVERGRAVLAAVYNPASGELFTARRGGGAARNGQPIAVADADRLEGAKLAGSRSLFRRGVWEKPWPEMEVAWVYSVAYRICLAASGRVQATASMTPMHEWDLAGASLVMEEAGGTVTASTGEPMVFNQEKPRVMGVIAAGPRLHRLLEERIGPVAREMHSKNS